MSPQTKALLWGAGSCVRSAFASFIAASGYLLAGALILAVLWLTLSPSVNPGRLVFGEDFSAAPPRRSTPKPLPTLPKTPDASDLRRILEAPGAELSAVETPGQGGARTFEIRVVVPAPSVSAAAPPEPPASPLEWLALALWAFFLATSAAALLQGLRSAARFFLENRQAQITHEDLSKAFFDGLASGSVHAFFHRLASACDFKTLATPPASAPAAAALGLHYASTLFLGAACAFATVAALLAACVFAFLWLASPLFVCLFDNLAPRVYAYVPFALAVWALLAAAFTVRAFAKARAAGAPNSAAAALGKAAASARHARDALLKAGSAKFASEEEKALASEIADAPCKKSPPRSL